MGSRLTSAYILLAIVVIVGFVVYLMKALSSQLVYGIDGPYYVLQVKYLLAHGWLKYLDPPLAFYVLAGFSVLVGDVFLGVKVGSIIVYLAASIPLFFLARRISNSSVGGLVAASSYVFSGYLVRLGFDFLKNAMGLLPLSLFFYTVLRGLEDDIRYSIVASVLLVVTGLTHILDFGVGYGFIIVLLVYNIVSRNRRTLKQILLPMAAGTLLLVAGFTVYTVMGGDPYKALNLLRLLGEEEGMITLTPWELAKTITPLILGLTGILLSMKLEGVGRQVVLAVSLVLIVLNIPLIPVQYLWRFNLMTSILAPIILGATTSLVKDNTSAAIIGLAVIGLLLPQFIIQLQAMHPSIPEPEYQELKQLVEKIPENTLIITPDTRLRYWIETLYENVAKKPPGPTPYPQLIVYDKNPNTRKPWIPRHAKEYYNGEYIKAYIISPQQ